MYVRSVCGETFALMDKAVQRIPQVIPYKIQCITYTLIVVSFPELCSTVDR